MALSQNAAVSSARHQVSQARHELESQRAEFMPQVNLYASRSLSKSATDTTIDQRYETTSAGIQVNIPLYSGGRSIATYKAASAGYGKEQYRLEETIRTTLNELQKAFRKSSHIHTRLRAHNLAVESARLQLTATQKGVAAGQRVNLDILNAEQQLYIAQQQLLEEKYNYIRAWMTLNYQSGKLTAEDIEKIDAYFN